MEQHEVPAWVGITYLVYVVSVLLILVGGAGYAAFVLGRSEWWIVAAILSCGLGWSPAKWRMLWSGKAPEDEDD